MILNYKTGKQENIENIRAELNNKNTREDAFMSLQRLVWDTMNSYIGNWQPCRSHWHKLA